MTREPCARIVAPVAALPSFAAWEKAKRQCLRCTGVRIQHVQDPLRGVFDVMRCVHEPADPVVHKRVPGGYCLDARTDGVCTEGQLFKERAGA